MKWMNDWRDPGDSPLTSFEIETIRRREEEEDRKIKDQRRKEDEALFKSVTDMLRAKGTIK